MKAEGEPEEKRGKIEQVEDEDEDEQEGEADEGPEEVQATNIWLMVYETQGDFKEDQSGLLGMFLHKGSTPQGQTLERKTAL